jgi:hypothetical protein
MRAASRTGARPGAVRPFLPAAGQVAESAQANLLRHNPMAGMPHYVLADAPTAAAIPPHVIAHYSLARLEAPANKCAGHLTLLDIRISLRIYGGLTLW